MTTMAVADEHEADPDKTPPGDDKGEKRPKVLTEDEFNRRMAGQAKELARYKAEVEAARKEKEEAERKRLEEEGRWKEIAEQRESELGSLREREGKRLERLTERNAARVKSLPSKEARDSARNWQDRMTADDFADWLDDLEKIIPSEKVRDVDGGGGRREGPPDDDETKKAKAREAIRERGREFIFGPKDKGGKK